MDHFLETPLWNIHLTEKERMEYLLSQLTMDEKFQCMGTVCPAIPRLGIPAFQIGGEGAHGVQARHDQDGSGPEYTTIFPNPIGMSATWDPALLKRAGRVTGIEARGLFAAGRHPCLSLWAPTVDLERDPRWGRTEEGYGEDPVLVSAMAGAYVEGMQGEDPEHLLTAATLKHFYANNVEEGRCYKSSAIDERNREEYYLEPFRRIIQEHGADGLMTAYNEVNGIPCMLNPEVRTLAKEKWGLRHVVCDGGDVSQTVEMHHYFTDHADTIAAGLEAGIDCFTDDDALVYKAVSDAYERGMITEEQIDEALGNHFGVMLRLGFFDPPGTNPYEQLGIQDVGTPEHQKIAREVATEAVVLLKNEVVKTHTGLEDSGNDGKTGNNAHVEEKEIPLLPLSDDRTVAVLGPLSTVCYKDWYSGIPPYYITPAQGLQDALGKQVIAVEDGTEIVKICLEKTSGDPLQKKYLGIDAVDGTLHMVSHEQAESFQIEYWGDGRITLRACSNGKLLTTEEAEDLGQTGLIRAVSEEAFGWFVREVYQLSQFGELYHGVPEHSDVMCLYSWNGAEIGFDAKGRLCVSLDQAEEGKSSSDTLQISLETVRNGIKETAKAAAQADVAILCLGAHPLITCKEEIDRTHLDLPPYQQAMMEAVLASNANTVLVLVSSIPFGIEWAKEHIPAILNTASGGMELGHGIADILTGVVSPAGRLPMTWYRSVQDLPSMDDYDIIQGERTYQYYQGEVLYPFGHGLTYGECRYEALNVEIMEKSGSEPDDFGSMIVQVKIRNISAVVTDDVVQIYGRKIDPVVKRPCKTLLAFCREKQIAKGEERIITCQIPLYDLCYYSVEQGHRVLESGQYEIMAGTSSEQICLRTQIVLS